MKPEPRFKKGDYIKYKLKDTFIVAKITQCTWNTAINMYLYQVFVIKDGKIDIHQKRTLMGGGMSLLHYMDDYIERMVLL